MNLFHTTLCQKSTIADHMLELRIDKPPGFDFQAGQFIQISAPAGEKQVFRSYSISSTPQDTYIELCVKLYDTGIASRLFQLAQTGDTISFKGPAGRFVVEGPTSDLCFIATGAGLAPIMGMIYDQLVYKKNTHKIHLIFGVRHEKDIFWTNRLDELQTKYPNFTYSLTLSQPKESWQGMRGRVTEQLPENTTDLHAFLCGSADMVKTVRNMLALRGTEIKNIHFEIF